MMATLPRNWRCVTEAHGGTGYGDERFSPTLYRWESYTTGHLWWKRTRRGWVFKGRFATEQGAYTYARDTERMMSQ